MAQAMADAPSAILMATVRRIVARSNDLKEAVVLTNAAAKAKSITRRKVVTDVVNLAISPSIAL